MSASAALPAAPSYFWWCETGGSLAQVAEVTKIGTFGMTRQVIEVSHLASDNNCKEFVAGMVDSGSLTIELNNIFSDTSQSNLWKAATSGSILGTYASANSPTIDFSVYTPAPYSTGAKYYKFSGSGFATETKILDHDLNGASRGSVTFKITGKITSSATATTNGG